MLTHRSLAVALTWVEKLSALSVSQPKTWMVRSPQK